MLQPTSRSAHAEHLKIVRSDDGEVASVFGVQRRILLGSEETGGQFMVCEVEAPSNSESPLLVHSREDQVLFVRSGYFEFFLDGERIEIGPGAVVYCPRDVPHCFCLMGEESGVALILAWPGGSEKYFRGCAHEFATGAPDFRKIVQISSEFGISLLAPEGIEAQRTMRTGVQKPRIVLPYSWPVRELDGTRVQRLLSHQETGNSCSLLEFVTPSVTGSTLTLPVRPQPPEIFFVQKGRYELALESEELQIEAGTLVYAPQAQVRAFRVLGEERGRLLLASFSRDLEEVFFPTHAI